MRKRRSLSPVIDERKRLYGTARWKRLRAATLKANPRCWRCGRNADSVDHVRHDDANARFFDPANVRSCCTPCNSSLAAAGRREARQRGGGDVSKVDRLASTPFSPTTQNIRAQRSVMPKVNNAMAVALRLLARPPVNPPSKQDDVT